MHNLFSHIRTRYHVLSPTQKKIADYVLAHADEVMLLSLGSFAEKCHTSETTILRFLHALDFDSYQVFRVRIAQDTAKHPGQAIYEEIQASDDLEQIRQKVILSTVHSLQDINNLIKAPVLERVVDWISTSERVLFCGVGASGVVAIDAFHKFLRLGLNVTYLNDTHFMNIACSHVGASTLVVAISHSGESKDILEAVGLAKEKNAKVVALTSYARSTLGSIADCVLLSSSNETKFRSDAMVSRILQLVIIDVLYVGVVLQLGDYGVEKINQSRLSVAKKKR